MALQSAGLEFHDSACGAWLGSTCCWARDALLAQSVIRRRRLRWRSLVREASRAADRRGSPKLCSRHLFSVSKEATF